jgi:SAM-dependent methyltransferase
LSKVRISGLLLDVHPMTAPATDSFYDELADDYDLIFEDWEASMDRQGDAIAALIGRYLPGTGLRVLDAAAGIGTQSLPLAKRGFRVSSRDLSAASIARFRREAAARGLSIEAKVSDMRTVAETTSERFDVVMAFDNALPHLLSDDELRMAFRAFRDALRPGGLCVFSVRDYDQVKRGGDSVHPHGVRYRNAIRYIVLQAWHWVSPTHYDTTFYVIADEQPNPRVRGVTARYYAVPPARLLALLEESGFIECERLDGIIYQPVLVARRPEDAG